MDCKEGRSTPPPFPSDSNADFYQDPLRSQRYPKRAVHASPGRATAPPVDVFWTRDCHVQAHPRDAGQGRRARPHPGRGMGTCARPAAARAGDRFSSSAHTAAITERSRTGRGRRLQPRLRRSRSRRRVIAITPLGRRQQGRAMCGLALSGRRDGCHATARDLLLGT